MIILTSIYSRYPFDSQNCSMVFIPSGNSHNFVEYEFDYFVYTGSPELTEYFIRDTVMHVIPLMVQVDVILGRKLLGAILTMYLPTILMNIIGKMHLTLKEKF